MPSVNHLVSPRLCQTTDQSIEPAQVFESMIKNKEIMILPIATSREQAGALLLCSAVGASRPGGVEQGAQRELDTPQQQQPPPWCRPPAMHWYCLPFTMQVDPARCLPATHADEALLLGGAANALTRRAGGRASSRPVPKRVVVDVREFMSSLPAVLHQQVGARGRGTCCRGATREGGVDAGRGMRVCGSQRSSLHNCP